MPTTTAGTTLSVLSVEGENHNQGWVFSIDPLSTDADLFEISDSGAGSEVIVKTTGPYVSPGDKYITVIATKGAVTYQSGVVIPVGDKGVELSSNTESVNFPVNMIAGQLSDTFAFRFAIRCDGSISETTNLLGVEGDEYGLVELTSASTLKFHEALDGSASLFESSTLVPNKWYDVTITASIGSVTITVNDETSGLVAMAGTPTFGSDLANPWGINGISREEYTIWGDSGETLDLGTVEIVGGAFGDLGSSVDHFDAVPVTTTVDTFTVWGDVAETINLGSVSVAIGSTPDHVSQLSESNAVMQISNVGAGHNGIELIREDLSGVTGGMNLGGTASLMAFIKQDS
jgi:hypothetical protein